MSEVRDGVNLSFMYKFCPQSRFAMSECIAIPEVRERMSELMQSGESNDPQVFLMTLKAVYNEKYAHKKENPDFCFASARKIIRELGTTFM